MLLTAGLQDCIRRLKVPVAYSWALKGSYIVASDAKYIMFRYVVFVLSYRIVEYVVGK